MLSPEALYAEAARGRNRAACAQLANRLSSSYSIDPDSKALVESTPRTSVAELASYLRKSALGERNRALRALRWALDGCASPMESNVSFLRAFPSATADGGSRSRR